MTPDHPHSSDSRRHPLANAALSLLLATPGAVLAQGQPGNPWAAGEGLPKSKPEMTNYEETSRYEDVMNFFGELQKKSPLIKVQPFGKTFEGREMLLVILSNPGVSTPQEAQALNKPIVFVMANIHAGEVEGKEAMQHFARRVLFGDLKPLLDKLVILIAPDYNADGNEKISLTNRTQQLGPINGAGVRENSQGFDLNRDYIKLEAPESRALVKLMIDWDPIMTVDLHTTNGSYHGFHLTYSIPLNPMTDGPIFSYHRDTMMPAIAASMLSDHKWRTYYYGNFSQGANPRSSGFGPASRAATSLPSPPIARGGRGGGGAGGGGGRGEQNVASDDAAWFAFSQAPRVGQNYVGLRNRFTILSESYSYIPFKDRIDSTADFVEVICQYVIAHGGEMTKMAHDADENATRRGQAAGEPFKLGIEYEQTPLANMVDIIVSNTIPVPNPKNNRNMRQMDESKNRVVKMVDYGTFAATQTVPTAKAYLFRNEPGTKIIVDKLLQHGIKVETLTAPATVDVDAFAITKVIKVATVFQTHREVKLEGDYKKESVTFPAGSFVVKASQPLSTLASFLLEPQSDDGLTTWNFLDDYLAEGKEHPVYKVETNFSGASKAVEK
jgi:hypothetical protein